MAEKKPLDWRKSPEPILVLIDGHALAYRAYFALANTGIRTRSGEPTHAAYGFALMLLTVWEEYNPEYLAVTFDVGLTFRHRQYAEYKATRDKMPDDMRSQVTRVEELVRAFNIPVFTADGFEADDVLGTLSRQAAQENLDTIIVTGDRDAFQLVGPHTKVLISGRSFAERQLYDQAAILERYGLMPVQLVELKGLMGDASDNIPGVKGIGEKTGIQLVQRFGSLENVYEHLDELAAGQRAKLETSRDDAFLSRSLSRIKTDVPGIQLDLPACRLRDFDQGRVLRLFQELEFRSLVDRIPGRVAPAPDSGRQLSMFGAVPATEPTPPVAGCEGDYCVVGSLEGLRDLAARLARGGRYSFDTEATGLDAVTADLVGVALSDEAGHAYYVPVRSPTITLDWGVARPVLSSLFSGTGATKVAHNAKFDMLILARHGVITSGTLVDTMVASWLIDPGGTHGLKNLAWTRLGQQMTEISTLIGTGRSQITMAEVPLERVAPYACADADMTLRLVDDLSAELKTRGAWSLFTDVEMPLVPVLADMEMAGIRMDPSVLATMSRDLSRRLTEIEAEIQDLVGYSFNLNSPQQLSDALFGKLGLPAANLRKTKSGHFSTAADVLDGLRGAHPVIDKMLEQRQLAKLKSTYVDALPGLVNPATGRVHTSFNQTGTVTGRISSSNPNLQNIPVRTEMGREVRRAFVAEPGARLVAADYSQVELRVMAHVSGDAGLRGAFERDEDIHAATAAAVLNVPLDQVTKDQRRVAKAVNFGLSYGQSAFGLSQQTGMTQTEAGQFIKTYFEKYPGVLEYIEHTKQQAAQLGYVETLLGRRRYFPGLASMRGPERGRAEREAINMPIQGTAADIIKIAMIRLHAELKSRGLKTRMLLQVHDELVLEAPDEELTGVVDLVRQVMNGAIELIVPLKVDVEIGQNWLEMTPAG